MPYDNTAGDIKDLIANTYGRGRAASSGVKQKSFRYPLQRLDDTSDYLEIKIFDYVKGDPEIGIPPKLKTAQQRLKANQTSPKYYILLPIPQNVSDSISVTWGDDNLNPVQGAAVALANSAVNGTIKIPTLSEVQEKFNNSNIKQDDLKGISSYIAGMAVNTLGANVSASGVLTRTTGKILNSNLELLFNGVNLRTFQFAFDLAPRSNSEAQEVKQMIRTFKKTMSAKNGGGGSGDNPNSGLFIDSPSVYQLTYRSGSRKHPFLNTFKPCALTDISVNYTASGTYATYDDGSPVHLQMSLTFKELNPVYNEDYEDEYSVQGVGY